MALWVNALVTLALQGAQLAMALRCFDGQDVATTPLGPRCTSRYRRALPPSSSPLPLTSSPVSSSSESSPGALTRLDARDLNVMTEKSCPGTSRGVALRPAGEREQKYGRRIDVGGWS